MKDPLSLSRHHLDARFKQMAPVDMFLRPQKGWLRAVREALGMTAEQVAQRLGVSKVRISRMEKDELRDALTLATLDKAAQAMGCRFIYAIVPQTSLRQMVEQQARDKARMQLDRTEHTMGLENQSVSRQETFDKDLQRLVEELMAGKPHQLWDEEP